MFTLVPGVVNATVSPECRQLVREFSEPAVLAHPSWWADHPPALLQAALQSDGGRRVLGQGLRTQIPLPRQWRETDCHRVLWALGDLHHVHGVVRHTGWQLLRGGVRQVVTRRAIENLVACVGREAYAQALAEEDDGFWPAATPGSAARPVDLPHLPTAAQTSAEAIATALYRTGWCALNQALSGELEAFRSRLHLLAGRDAAAARCQSPWPFDADALLLSLAHIAPEAFH
jgi:hypothetical protein